jgi:hypothetical protein
MPNLTGVGDVQLRIDFTMKPELEGAGVQAERKQI